MGTWDMGYTGTGTGIGMEACGILTGRGILGWVGKENTKVSRGII